MNAPAGVRHPHNMHNLGVGVTLHLTQGYQSVWENGMFQNCAFLVQLLQRSPVVGRAVLVNSGDARVPHEAMMLGGEFTVVDLADAMRSLDVVIEMSSQLPADWVAQFRARGGRYAAMRVGNEYVIDVERSIFDRPHCALVDANRYDATWTLPQYEHSCKDYFAIAARAPVKVLPHLWTPWFIDRAAAAWPQGRFGYQPGRQRWRVCCFESNLSMVKTSFIPMLCCEEAYRAQPSFLECARFANTLHMKEQPDFLAFARGLDIVDRRLVAFDARHPVFAYMAQLGDCIVSHQWENGQNYLYYEALYGGYPLVHNSPMLRDFGYHYPDFDCREGGRALLRAFAEHDRQLPLYREKARDLFRRLDVANPDNIDAYTRELLSLFAP